MWCVIRKDELYHHGILGQKWGKRNGPPYPLDVKRHSASEKKAGWRNSLDKDSSESYNKDRKKHKGLSDKQKRAIKIGAATIAAGLAIYGGYSLLKSGKIDSAISHFSQNGKSFVDNELFGASAAPVGTVGRTNAQIDRQMVLKINRKNRNPITGDLKPGSDLNCFHTSSAYILNSLFGIRCTAKGFNGVDESSGIQRAGRDLNLFYSIFENIKIEKLSKSCSVIDAVDKLAPKTTGVMGIKWPDGTRHLINYEKAANGITTFIDAQDGSIYDSSYAVERFTPLAFIDFSKAIIKNDAYSILDNIIQR